MSSVCRGCRSSPHESATTVLLLRFATVYCVFCLQHLYYCFTTLYYYFLLFVYYCFNTNTNSLILVFQYQQSNTNTSYSRTLSFPDSRDHLVQSLLDGTPGVAIWEVESLEESPRKVRKIGGDRREGEKVRGGLPEGLWALRVSGERPPETTVLSTLELRSTPTPIVQQSNTNTSSPILMLVV